MISLYLVFYSAFLLWQQWVLPAASEDIQGIVSTPRQCAQQLRKPIITHTDVLPQRIEVLSWNIYKAQHEQLLPDLRALSQGVDFVLLQEAFRDQQLFAIKPYARFSPGFRGWSKQTGTLLLSDFQPQLYCRFYQREPWLRTPKASSISRYALAQGGSLLVVNLHGINFTWGTEDYQRQLKTLTLLIAQHNGPVIFAGDFNTWSHSRQQLVQQLLTPLQLAPVTLSPDQRTRFFGYALDQVWTRGVEIKRAQALARESSDHNPILVSLSL